MTDNTQPEALRLAAEFEKDGWIAGTKQWCAEVSAELRRQHVLLDEQQLTIAALNSCIGCETTTENLTAVGRLEARIADLEAQLASAGFTAADMATASAQGFRDGVASLAASAGEPAAYLIDWPDEPELGHYFSESPTETGRCRPLYLAAPPTAQAEGWRLIPVEPTGAMLAAAEMALYEARSTLGRYAAHKAAYRALLDAAPLLPTSAEGAEHG